MQKNPIKGKNVRKLQILLWLKMILFFISKKSKQTFMDFLIFKVFKKYK